MKALKTALSYGFLVWGIPFVVAIMIFPLRASERPLFESIMPVVLTLSTVVFTTLYFRKVQTGFVLEGVSIGLVWLGMSVGIDLLMFMQGPMQMIPIDYVKDIGLTYLVIPAITTGFGYACKEQYLKPR